MLENKQKIISFVIKEECNPGEEMTGSYHCAKGDLGACTKFGISQKSHPNVDIKNLTRDEAIDIYDKEYWQQIEGDTLPTGLDLLVMDFAVTSGPRRALGMYHQMLEMTGCGDLGCDDSIGAYTNIRKEYYNHIVSAMPSQRVNLRDWLIRADHALAAARALWEEEVKQNDARSEKT